MYQLSGKLTPPMTNLVPKMSPVQNQEALGDCTAYGIGGAIEYNFNLMGHPFFVPSHLFIYWNERNKEHSVNSDSGAMISDGLYVVNKYGVCPETLWPYDISKFKIKPPLACYTAAKKDIVLRYKRLVGLAQIKDAMAAGYPVIFGFSVYESFESDEVTNTGIVPMPQPGEQLLGGHCVLSAMYDDSIQKVITKNSWGTDWGMKPPSGTERGYFELPYDYFTNGLVSDCWVIYYTL
jgi:C1A family cysteine protease